MTTLAERPVSGSSRSTRRPSRVLGSTTPRLFTPPLRKLTPRTSIGFEHVAWARDTLGRPFDAWQQEVVIRAGELRPRSRRLRFRRVFVIVARQNGKTEIPVIMSARWLCADPPGLILGTSTVLDYARESFDKVVTLIEATGAFNDLRVSLPARWTREANGEVTARMLNGARYKIAPSSRRGGRSLTIRRLVLDELREHQTYAAWGAAVPATIAVEDAQVWALSNAGDDTSVVLNDMRDGVVETLEDGTERVRDDPDTDTLWLEWSAPANASPTDVRALAAANPNMNRPGRVDGEALLRMARAAVEAGGQQLTAFKTEHMCIRVRHLDPAIDAEAWDEGRRPGDLAAYRSRTALLFDVSPDLFHVALYAAAVVGGDVVRVDHVADWAGRDAVSRAGREIRGHVRRVRPKVLGWLPVSPAAALAAYVRPVEGDRTWPPAGVDVREVTAEVPSICMGFAANVAGGRVLHVADALLDAHVGGAERLMIGSGTGSRWVFSRKGGHVTAAYAAAGADFLARTLPAPVGSVRIITARG